MIHPSFVEQASNLAKDSKSERMAMVYTGLAVTVMAIMALREVRDMFKDHKRASGRER